MSRIHDVGRERCQDQPLLRLEATGLGQANVSRHLQILHTLGFVARRKEGLQVFCALADESVFALCDSACGGIRELNGSRLRTVDGRS